MQLMISWLVLSFGLWLSHKFISKFSIEGGVGSFILVGAIVGVLHFLFGWLIYGVLAFATLGLGFLLGFVTRLIVTAVVLKLADVISSRFKIEGFLPALWAACLLAVVSAGVDWITQQAGLF